MAPIFLSNTNVTQCSDDAGLLITTTVLPSYIRGPYTPDLLSDHLKTPEVLRHVPPLAYFCINSLIQNVDAVDLGGCPRIPYTESHMHVLKCFMAFFDSDTQEKDMVYVDPRVWAALIQVYSLLPKCFDTYTIPLSDTHLTMLQGIQSTPDFTLITVLDLSSRSEMNDASIGKLKPLANLCVLDLSGTQVGSWGVRKLSMCLVRSGKAWSGPWGLRMWSLRDCKKVDDSARQCLSKFPLLCVIDLRGTSIIASVAFDGFDANPPFTHDGFYHPNPPLSWIPALSNFFRDCRLFKADAAPHVLHINKLDHPRHMLRQTCSASDDGEINAQDRVLALFPGGQQTLYTTHSLSQVEKEEVADRRRKAALQRWAERPERECEWHCEDEEVEIFHESDSDEWAQSEGDTVDDTGPFDLGHHSLYGNSNDDLEINWPSSQRDDEMRMTERFNEAAQRQRENQVFTFLKGRETAERETRNFYAKTPSERLESTLRLRNGTLHGDLSSAHKTGQDIRQPQYLACGSTERKRRLLAANKNCQRSLMLFRTPPRVDSIPDMAPAVNPKRKNLDKDVISVKKRKAAMIISASSKALWNSRRRSTKLKSMNNVEPENKNPHSSPMLTFRGGGLGSLSGHNRSVNCTEAKISMNPFLAKKMSSSRCQRLTVLPSTDPSLCCPSSSETSISKSPMGASTTDNKPPLKSGPSHSRTQQGTGLHTKSRKSREGRGVATGSRGFDMRAWATQVKQV